MSSFFDNVKTISIHDKNKGQINYEKKQSQFEKNRLEYNRRQREYKKIWRKENFEHIRQQHKEWRKNNPVSYANNWKRRNKKLAEKIQCPLCLKKVSIHTFKWGTHKDYKGCRVAKWVRIVNKKIETT